MRKAWAVARNDLQIVLQSRQSWFFLLLVPALVIYLAGLGARAVAQDFVPVIRVDLLDDDRSPASQALALAVAEANPAFVLCPSYGAPPEACRLGGAALSPDLAATRLAAEIAAATITIPQGFAAALDEGRRVTLEFHPGPALIAPDMVLWALRAAVTGMAGPVIAAQMSTELVRSLGIATAAGFAAEQLAAAQAAWGPPAPVRVTREMTGTSDKLALGAHVLSNGFQLSTPSVAAMFVMISILGLAQTLAEERLLGILRRIAALPVRRAEWLAGKLAATSLLGLTQLVILLGFGAALGVDFGKAPGAVLLVSAAYVLAVTALALALAALARSPQQASAFATAAWLVLTPLGGGWWPLAFVPAWLRTAGHLSPVAWYLDALNAIIFSGATWADVLAPTAALTLFAALCFGVGILSLDFCQAGGERPSAR